MQEEGKEMRPVPLPCGIQREVREYTQNENVYNRIRQKYPTIKNIHRNDPTLCKY